jgi:D-alanyl-D-alanine carboxypeptidase (penicillin-binding protein 5/6)
MADIFQPMKRPLAVLLTLLAALAAPIPVPAQIRAVAPEEEGNLSAAAWVIADSTTGFVLDSSNAKREVQIGSITKIATAMVVLDWAKAQGQDMSQFATVPETVGALNSPNSIGLRSGDTISLRDALYAALLQSDNEAAETLAVHVGRAIGRGRTDRETSDFFVAQMNALARKLGMRSTRFLNPHGLDDLEKKLPYSTAGDVALLTNYAVGQTGFMFYTSQKERKISWKTATGESQAYLLKNTNELLGSDGVDGVKTGTTRRAGACVVISSAKPPDSRQVGEQHIIVPRRLTIVVLGAPSRFSVARSLLARGWALLDQWAQAGRPMKGWRPTASR